MKGVTEYRMWVHVFDNGPSPAVGIYGLRCGGKKGAKKFGSRCRFVERHFYVDDELTSLPGESEAIDLMTRTQASLAQSDLKLHKIASNSPTVLNAFPPDDLAKGMKDVSLSSENLPTVLGNKHRQNNLLSVGKAESIHTSRASVDSEWHL